MNIKVKEGCIKVNNIYTKKLSDDAFFVHIDLKAKYAEVDAYTNNGIVISKAEPTEFSSGTLHTEESEEDTTIEFEGFIASNFMISSYTLSGMLFKKSVYEDFGTKAWQEEKINYEK